MTLQYKRVLLKVSGQALQGQYQLGIDTQVIEHLITEVSTILALGCEVCMVVGGGNFFRGKQLEQKGIGRTTGDNMGMLGTVLNALAIRDMCENAGIDSRVMSALPVPGVVGGYEVHKALRYMRLGRLVIYAGGTGSTLVTTDTAASLRAIEAKADILIKMTRVNGVYDKDPEYYPDAKHYPTLSFDEALNRHINVMDKVAFYQCYEYDLPICVYDMHIPGALAKIVCGKAIGTLVTR